MENKQFEDFWNFDYANHDLDNEDFDSIDYYTVEKIFMAGFFASQQKPDLETEKEAFAVGFAKYVNDSDYWHNGSGWISFLKPEIEQLALTDEQLIELYKNRDNGK